ncbi:MAG: c-type cytochrome domain-containing protein [Planctomycetota bacterium]
MTIRSQHILFLVSALLSVSGLIAADNAISFRSQVAPILLEKCQTCHGPASAKGGVRVDSFDFLMRKEDDGDPMVVPGKPEKSDLWKLLVTAETEERMPQKSDPLPKETTEIIRRWIAEGAHFDGTEKSAALVEIVPPRTHPKAPESYTLPIPVTALVFSPDGSELVVGGVRELTVWNASTGALVRRISNVAPRIFALAFHPDAAVIAAAGGAPGEFGEVRLFDFKTGEMRMQVAGSIDAIMDVKFSPDGKRLATAGADHHINIFTVETGARIRHLSVHSDAVTSVAFSPDGKQLASVGLDRSAKVFDIESGKLVSTYREHTGPLYAVAFAPGGKEIISAGREKQIQQWSAADAKKVRTLDEPDVLKFAVGEKTIFLGGANKRLRQFDYAGAESKISFAPLTDWIYAVAVHSGTKRVAVGCYDGTVSIFNLDDGKAVTTFIPSPGYKALDTKSNKTAGH